MVPLQIIANDDEDAPRQSAGRVLSRGCDLRVADVRVGLRFGFFLLLSQLVVRVVLLLLLLGSQQQLLALDGHGRLEDDGGGRRDRDCRGRRRGR